MRPPIRSGHNIVQSIGIAIAFFALFAVVSDAVGQQGFAVRGRLVRQSGMPAVGVPVSVFNPQRGRSGMSFSAQDGMYYLHGIPSGQYTLEVWVFPNNPPWVFQIIVRPQPTNDIAPIRLPG